MISFKQFLSESQNYPLYHGTDLISLISIVQNDAIRTGSDYPGYHWPSKTGKIISTTRNLNFARYWAEQRINKNWVVLELDREKLKQNYKIVPFNYFGQQMTDPNPQARWTHGKSMAPWQTVDRNQFEEAITKDIKSALKYIKYVYMSSNTKKILKRRAPAVYDKLINKVNHD